ncbi:MAG: hypothetical protein NC914_01590 [Candidatus Omnitrophica bacterium]|nr:hypothetical protein [Candidatus Omnitrophota bacterium]
MRRNSGFALMAALIILVLFAALGFVAVNLFFSDTRIAYDSLKSMQALYLAEAGLQYALENLSGDDDWSDNSDIAMNMTAGGSFNVHYLAKSQNSATLKLTGTKDEVSRKFNINVERSPLAGFGLLVGQSIHEQQSKYREFPDFLEGAPMPFIDLSFYESIADHKVSGNYTFTAGTYYGVWFINGNVSIEDNVTIYGTVIANGNVDIEGNHITIDAYPYPLRGARRKYSAAYWSQSGLGSYDGAKVNDGVIDVSCFNTSSSGSGAYLQLDLGACNEREFIKAEFIYITAGDYASWKIQYSDNGTSWTDAAGLTTESIGKKYRYIWDSAGPHRYWRLVKTSSGNGGTYAEAQFVSNLNSTQVLEPQSLNRSTSCYWSQSGLGSFSDIKVNDGNATASCFNTDSSDPGAYLQLDLGADPFKYNKFTQAAVDIADAPAYATWNIEYYDDKYTSSWRSVKEGAGGHPVSVGKYNCSWAYNIEDWGGVDRSWTDADHYYRYWRLYKTDEAASGGNHAEVQFSAALFPALVGTGNFLFQHAEDLTIIGLVYVGADLTGNLLAQQTENINFIGVVLVAGNFNLQQSKYMTIVFQQQGDVPGINPALSAVPVFSHWKETD